MHAVKKRKTTVFINILINVVIVCLAIVASLAFVKFVGFPSTVSGTSMTPSYANGDKVIVASTKIKKQINRFDVVVAKADGVTFIKRVIGLPDETIVIDDGQIKINGEVFDDIITGKIEDAGCLDVPVHIEDKSYVLLGDNRNNSFDSRNFGVVNESDIKGIVVSRFRK